MGADWPRGWTSRPPERGDGRRRVEVLAQVAEALGYAHAQGVVHRDLETIAIRCLEKDPARRFADGAELAAELRRWIDGEPILSRPCRGSSGRGARP